MNIVYAKTSAVIGQHSVVKGSHWPADDPVVRLSPSTFSEDPRYGLSYSEVPAEEQAASVQVFEAATKEPGEKRLTRPRTESRG